MTVLATAADNLGRLAGKQRKRQDAALLSRYAMIEGDGAMGVSGGCTKSTSYFQKYCSRGWSAQSTRPREKKEYEDE
jgi:hypothetical protein